MYSDNQDNQAIAGEALDFGGGKGRISYQGFYCSDWPKDHELHGNWRSFKGDTDNEAFSSVDVPVVGAWVFQSSLLVSFRNSKILVGKN